MEAGCGKVPFHCQHPLFSFAQQHQGFSESPIKCTHREIFPLSMVNGLSFNPGLDCPQAEESTRQIFLPTLCEFPNHWVFEREEPPLSWKKGFKRKGLTCMVGRPAFAYLQSTATDPEWKPHIPGILRQSEPARSLLKVLIAQVTHCEWITSEISWVCINFE